MPHSTCTMLGGFVTVTLTNELGWPFLASLPVAFLSAALVSVAFERVLYRRLYGASDLDQCLLTIGIVFVSVAVAAYIYGTIQQPLNLQTYLRGPVSIFGQSFAGDSPASAARSPSRSSASITHSPSRTSSTS